MSDFAMNPRPPRRVPLTSFAVLAVLAVAVFAYSNRARSSPVEWYEDFGTAAEVARAEGLPLLVKFSADWCPACHELERSVLSEESWADVVRGRFILVAIDLTHQEQPQASLAERYDIEALPSVLIVDPTSGLVLAVAGAREMTLEGMIGFARRNGKPVA